MKKEFLTSRQLMCITALFIIGSSSVIGNSGIAKRDTWVAMLLAMAVSVPLVLMYGRISTLFQESNLFEIIHRVFGTVFGWIISLSMTLYCFYLGTVVLRDFPEFVQTVSFRRTPKIIFAMLVGLLCAYLARLGIRSLGKAGILFAVMVGASAITTFLLLLPNMEMENIRPVLSTPLDVVALNSAKLFGTPFGETILLLSLYCNHKPTQNKQRTFLLGLLLGGGYLVVSVVRNILSLGAGNFASLYFPSYNAVSTINIGDFLQRVEVIVVSYMLMCDIIKVAIAIYTTCLGVAALLGIPDYKKLVLPISWLMIGLSMVMFHNTMEFFQWSPWFFTYSLPFQVVIPLILWIWAECNKRKLLL